MLFSKNFKRKTKEIALNSLYYGAKISAFLFWASLYLLVMRLTLFKSNTDTTTPATKDWMSDPDDYIKSLDPISAEETENFDSTEWSKPTNETIEDLNQRKATVQHVCRIRKLSTEDINSKEFFVDHKHGLVWCNIFKAASTFWLHKFNILGGYSKKFLANTQRYPLELAREKFPAPSVQEVRDAITSPGVLSFMVVRDPFVRLLSAYRDKLEFPHAYYRKLANSIKEYNDHETRLKMNSPKKIWRKSRGRGPTFKQFVSYLIGKHKENNNTVFNEHWTPYHKFCSPCAVNFSVIGKVESLSRDYSFVVHQLGLGKVLHNKISDRSYKQVVLNKAKDGRNTTTIVKHYFSQLTETMLNDLLEIFGIDFEMFGYDPEVYYGYVEE